MLTSTVMIRRMKSNILKNLPSKIREKAFVNIDDEGLKNEFRTYMVCSFYILIVIVVLPMLLLPRVGGVGDICALKQPLIIDISIFGSSHVKIYIATITPRKGCIG